MNNKKRDKIISQAIPLLNRASEIISSVLDDEQDCCDNYPENLQGSARYEAIENAIDYLEEAVSGIDSIKDNLELAIS